MPNEEVTNANTASVEEILAKLKFKKISEFPKLEELTEDDTLILVDGNLGVVGRVTAKELMSWFNDNLKNFICWRPIVEDNTLKWVRDKLDIAPADLKFTDIVFPMASETENGMIDPDMYVIIQKLISTYDSLVTDSQLDEKLKDKAEKDHVHKQYATNDALQKLINDIADADYVENALLEELVKSKGFIKLTDIKTVSKDNDGFMTSDLLAQLLANTKALENVALKDHVHDQYLNKDQVQKIVDSEVPTKISELENDSGFIREEDVTHPGATSTSPGTVMVPDDSGIELEPDTQSIDIKPFNVQNMLANTDFSTYYTVNNVTEFDGWFRYPTDDAAMSIEHGDGSGMLNSYALCHLFNGTGIGQRIKGMETVPTQVTISFYARASAQKHIDVILFGLTAHLELTAEWQLFIVKLSNPATTIADTNDVFAITGTNDNTDSVDVYITHIMCQRGSTPTGWCRYQMDIIPVDALPKASKNSYGVIKPDGTTIVVDANGIAHSAMTIDGKNIAVIDDSADGDPSVTWSSFLIGEHINTLKQSIVDTNVSVSSLETNIEGIRSSMTDIINNLQFKAESMRTEDDVLYLLGTPTQKDDGSYEENILASVTVSTKGGGGTVIKKSVMPTEETADVAIPTEFGTSENILVYYNGILMEEGTNFTITDNKISAVGFTFPAGSIITFVGGNANDAINLNTPADQITISDPDNLFDGALSVEGGMKVLAKKIANTAPKASSITLKANGWNVNIQTISVASVTADNVVILTPSYDSQTAYFKYGVNCVSQSVGSLKFECTETPLEDVTINVITF